MVRRALKAIAVGLTSVVAIFWAIPLLGLLLFASVVGITATETAASKALGSLFHWLMFTLTNPRVPSDYMGAAIITFAASMAFALMLACWLAWVIRWCLGKPGPLLPHAVWVGPMMVAVWLVGNEQYDKRVGCSLSSEEALAIARDYASSLPSSHPRTFDVSLSDYFYNAEGFTFEYFASDCEGVVFVDSCRGVDTMSTNCDGRSR